MDNHLQVQGLVNTFGDLRGSLSAVDRINTVLSAVEIDKALAYGLEREMHKKESPDEKYKLFLVNGFDEKVLSPSGHYMSALKSASSVCSLAWSSDVTLEGILNTIMHSLLASMKLSILCFMYVFYLLSLICAKAILDVTSITRKELSLEF